MNREHIQIIDERIQALDKLAKRLFDGESDYTDFFQRLRRWDDRAVSALARHLSVREGKKLELVAKGFSNRHTVDSVKTAVQRRRSFLEALKETIQEDPESIAISRKDEAPKPIGEPRSIFIVHGHDEVNLLRLEKLLRTKWDLQPIVLRGMPGKGRTIIEKFEQEAPRARYALVLLTPDDLVAKQQGEYPQARPNVIFELGWFYGRLERARVCILMKRGTRIHSDLEGITRIEFVESVEETALQLEQELAGAQIL